jgi:hypothetical protein
MHARGETEDEVETFGAKILVLVDRSSSGPGRRSAEDRRKATDIGNFCVTT